MCTPDNFLQKLILVSYFIPCRIKHPDAWVGHLPFAYWLIETFRPKIFVELGTHTGNSYFGFCQSVRDHKLQTKCFAVDTWEGDEHAGMYSNDVYLDVSQFNDANFSSFSRLLRMKFDDALAYFGESSIDLLHIDGLHTYEAVKHDFESWLPKLSKHAIILFHDTNVRERGFGVWKLFDELKQQYPRNFEFIQSHGLGIIQLKDDPVDHSMNYFFDDEKNKVMFTNYFSSLGEKQILAFLNQEYIQSNAKSRELLIALQSRIEEKDQEILNLLAENDKTVAYKDSVIASILNSTSMRVTKPLRMLSGMLKSKPSVGADKENKH